MELSDKDSKETGKMYVKYFLGFLALCIIIFILFVYKEKNPENFSLTNYIHSEVSISEETKDNDAILIKNLISQSVGDNTASTSFAFDSVTDLIKKYQSNQGIISANVSYGKIGPITRASLNSEFSDQKGGVAVVEGEYSDAWLLNNGAFISPNTPSYDRDINIWVKPYALTMRDEFLFGNGEYGIGIKEKGKIFVRTSRGDVVTENSYVVLDEWQHISISISSYEVSIFYNNNLIEDINLSKATQVASISSSIEEVEMFIVRTMHGVFSSALSEILEIKEENKILSFITNFFSNEKKEPYYLDQKLTVIIPPTLEEFRKEVQVFEIITEEAEEQDEINTGTTTEIFVGTSTPEIIIETASSTVSTEIATSTTKEEVKVTSGGGGGSISTNTTPVITLNGSVSVEIELGSIYIDPGATASDAEDGIITGNIVVVGVVDHTTPGEYLIRYNVSDSKGTSATEIIRTIVVNIQELTEEQQAPRGYVLASAGENTTYKVSGVKGADPSFVEVDISPLHVYVGDTQTMTIKVKSESGISSVQSITELDTTTLTLDFYEISSDETGTVFSTSWTVSDTHTEIYRTEFIAVNDNGDSNSTTMAWSDPCTGLNDGQDSTLTQTSCAVSGVNGLDGGSLTIPSGKSITLNEGSTWVWNPGETITVNGTINIAKSGSGASLKKGYLFYSGTDYDGANTVTRVYSSTASLSNHVRVSWWEGITANSCSLSVSPTAIAQGNSSTLTWSTAGDRSSFSINQSVGSKTINGGSVSVSPSSTLTYTGTVTGDGGTNTCQAALTVYPTPTCAFTASPPLPLAGDTVTISWTSTNATSFSINQGIGSKPTSGSTNVTATLAGKTYTGTIVGAGGSNTCSIGILGIEDPCPSGCGK